MAITWQLERAQSAEAKAEELQAELKVVQTEFVTQMEAAGSAHAETRAELQETMEALREQTELAAAVAAALGELEVELSEARQTADSRPMRCRSSPACRRSSQRADRAFGPSRPSRIRRRPGPRATGSAGSRPG